MIGGRSESDLIKYRGQDKGVFHEKILFGIIGSHSGIVSLS